MNKKALNFCKKYSYRIYMALVLIFGISANIELILRLMEYKIHIIFLIITVVSYIFLVAYRFFEYRHKIGYYEPEE